MGSTFDYTQAERQRDINAGLYNALVIPDVIADMEVSISAETSEVITVTCAVVDADGNNIAKRHVVQLQLFTDDDYDTLISALAGITYAATTGTKLPAAFTTTSNVDMKFLTDADGDLVFTITDGSAGTEGAALGFFLANDIFIEGGEFLFGA